MDMKTARRALWRAGILLVCYILQTDVFTHLKISGVSPLALPLAAVGFGLFEGGLTGGLWGLAAGILCDISVGSSLMFTILLTLFGFVSGFLSEFILARGFPSYIALCLAGLLICSALQAAPLIFFDGVKLSALVRPAIVQTLYSLIFVLPAYWSTRTASRAKGR